LDAHSGSAEPVDECSQRFPLFLADADQRYGRQVVGAACCELNIKFGHQSFEAVY